MNPILIAGPAVEPVAVAEMRAFLRLDDAAEDDLVSALIGAARRCVEASAGRILISQAWRLHLDGWPADRVVNVPLSPLIAVDAVRVFDAAGVPAVVLSALYSTEAACDPPRIILDAAIPVPGHARQGIEIDIRVGYGASAESVPEPLRHAIRMLAARWFESRGDDAAAAPPPDVLALIAPFRRVRL